MFKISLFSTGKACNAQKINKPQKSNEEKSTLRAVFDKFTTSVVIAGALALIIFIITVNSTEFADFYNRYIGSFVRAALAVVTNIFPFLRLIIRTKFPTAFIH